MFIYNKKLKFIILCVILINIHQNVAKKYFGLNLVFTRSGIKQHHYMFEKVSISNDSEIVQFLISTPYDFNFPRGGFPNLDEVEELLHFSFYHSNVFPNWANELIDFSFSVLVTLGTETNQFGVNEYVSEFNEKIEAYFEPYIQMGLDLNIYGIIKRPIDAANLLYLSNNFNYNTNELTSTNIINVSSEGTTITYISTLDELRKLNYVEAKLYYSQLDSRRTPTILFETRAHCFTVEKIKIMSILYFISKSKWEGRSFFFDKGHPCFSEGTRVPFNIEEEDQTDECIKDFIPRKIRIGSYTVHGEFDLLMCVEHLKGVLKRNIFCKYVNLCWLNFDQKIFAKPLHMQFHLTGDMYSTAYSSTTFNLIQMRFTLQAIMNNFKTHIPSMKANIQIQSMYFLTLLEILCETFDGDPATIQLQAVELPKYDGTVFLDTRLGELLPQLQVDGLHKSNDW